MKLAVHCAPAVRVWTPGWMAAVAAGAHAGAADPERGASENAEPSARLATTANCTTLRTVASMNAT